MPNSDLELAKAQALVDRRRQMREGDFSDADAVLFRVSPEGRKLAQRARARRSRARRRIFGRLMLALAAVMLVAIAYGVVVGPIGQIGFLAALIALVASWSVILVTARAVEETPERLVASDLAELPGRTEAWLQRQRPLLPPPAIRLADEIGAKLETLAPQLAALDPAEPAAAGIRKLLAQELPELVQGYGRVPTSLRRTAPEGGAAPDRQLLDGLATVDQELARMSADLASGDLQKLATQNRYLELKYRDADEA